MPLVDYVKVHGDDVAKLLQPGERLIDMGPYSEPHIGDESGLARTVDEMSPRMREWVRKTGQSPPPPSDRLIEGFDPLAGGLQVNSSRINRWLGGISGIGSPGSIAGQMWRTTRQQTKIMTYGVTDRRLLLMIEPAMGDFHVIFAVPRDQIVSATHRGKLLFQRGRVEVRFTDGSMKAWTPGMLSAARTRSLVTALMSAQGVEG